MPWFTPVWVGNHGQTDREVPGCASGCSEGRVRGQTPKVCVGEGRVWGGPLRFVWRGGEGPGQTPEVCVEEGRVRGQTPGVCVEQRSQADPNVSGSVCRRRPWIRPWIRPRSETKDMADMSEKSRG